MDREHIVKFVIRQSKKRRSQDDIILAVCQQAGLQWPDADKLVNRIQDTHRDEIGSSENRLLLLISILTCVAGLGMSLTAVSLTLGGTIIFFLFFPLPYLGNAALFGGGLIMIAGSIKGTQSLRR